MKTALLLAALTCALAPAAGASTLRLLAFGDSLTSGYGLEPAEGLVPRLEDWLARHGHDVIIVNDGVAGDTTAHGLARIDESLARHKPDGVIVELGGNDLLYDQGVQGAERNLDAILSKARAKGRPVLLVGIAKPDPDVARRESWAAIWPRLANHHNSLLLENLYAPFFAVPPDQLPGLLQPDGTHPSAAGVNIIVEELGPKVVDLIRQIDAAQIAAPTE